jgi:hypothetical protein
LSGLSETSQIRLLALISLELTIFARSAYSSQASPADCAKLQKINELQHRIADRIVHLSNRTETYPPEIFASMVIEGADEIGCGAMLQRVLRTALTS